MKDTADTAKPKKPLWRRILKWGIRVALVLVVLMVVLWSSWNWLAARSLRNEIERIQAAGEPVTFRDLKAPLAKVDRASDAGPLYRAARELLRRRYSDEAMAIEEGFDQAVTDRALPSQELLARAVEILKQNRTALELLDEGGNLSGCDYDLGLDYGISVVLSRLNPARTIAKMNSLRTKFLAFQGRGDEASRSAVSSLRMLRMFDRQPIMICHMVKIACLAIATDDIPVILEFGQPSAEAMQELGNALRQAGQSINLKRVLIAERVYTLEVMRNLISSLRRLNANAGTRPLISETWPSSFATTPIARSLAAKLLRSQARLIEAADTDWPNLLEAVKRSRPQGRSWSPFDVFARISEPAIQHAIIQTGRCIATTRSALVAVMIERYRRLKGSAPDTLEELASALDTKIPIDPFTGKSLIYRQASDGYKVYGLGEDRTDDDGNLFGPDTKGSDWGVQIRARPSADD